MTFGILRDNKNNIACPGWHGSLLTTWRLGAGSPRAPSPWWPCNTCRPACAPSSPSSDRPGHSRTHCHSPRRDWHLQSHTRDKCSSEDPESEKWLYQRQWWMTANSFWQKSSQGVKRDWGRHLRTETTWWEERGDGGKQGKGKFTQFITALLNNL